MNSSKTHVSTVKRILAAILPKFGEERKNQYELSLIAKRIKKNNSNLYSPVSGKVLPDFSEAIYKLMLNLDYFKPILESSVGAEDPNQLEKFQKKLLNRIIHSKKLNLDMFEFDKIKKETFKNKGRGHIDRIKSLFKIRFASLTSLKTEKIHQSYKTVLQLWMLASFNFPRLLNNLQKKKSNGSMGFISCYGDIILDDLKDLYFLSADFKLNNAGLKMMEFISSIQKENPVLEQEILSHYAGIQEFLDTEVPSNLLADIIKSSSLEPNIELKKQEINVNFIKKIQTDILDLFKNLSDTYQKETTEKAYRSQIDQLFQNTSLLTLEGYTRETNKLLSSNGLPGLIYITALRLIKTFTISFYDESIEELLTYFLEKADFISPKYKDRLVVYHISCNELSKSIEKFENDLIDPKISKLLPIMQQCTEGNINPGSRKQIETTIKGINKLQQILLNQELQDITI